MRNSISSITIREAHLAPKVVFVDGLPGCGKTMFSPILASMDRVELLTYAYELEYVCSLDYLGKLDRDAAVSMARILTDLQIYNTMMGRETNFRYSDLSSAFRHKPVRYLRRLFGPGDEAVPDVIEKEQPILLLTTHNTLAISDPVFEGLGSRAVCIEIVRHPLYMLRQQELNMQNLLNTVRDFIVYIEHKGHSLPFWTYGWEDLFVSSSALEKAMHWIDRWSRFTEESKERLREKYGAQVLTIPFERFVTDSDPYMKQVEDMVGTSRTEYTKKAMKQQNVPRKMYAEGIDLDIYKRCGWEPPKSGSENEEFEVRWQHACSNISEEAQEALKVSCARYEEKYMGGRINEQLD
jgi:hypothetical protein